MRASVLKLQVGQLHSNCYIVKVSKADAVIIDPGDDAEFIIEKLQTAELTPLAILATHGHFDHIMAGFSLQAAFNIPFYIHKKDDFLLTRMRQTALHFHETDPGPPAIPTFFEEKTKLRIGDSEIKIIETPGHTPGSVSFRIGDNLFVGDLLFADGTIGEVTHSYSDREKDKKSIKKILKLDTDFVVYPGHGEEITVGELKDKFKWALI